MTFRESEATAHDPSFSASSLSNVAIHISRSQFFLPFRSTTVPQKRYQLNICGGYIRRAWRVFHRLRVYTFARVVRGYIRFPAVRCLTYVGTARSYYSMRGAAGEGSKARRQVGWNVSAARVAWHVEKKIGSRALLTGASMRLFDTSSDKRPPYYLPIVVVVVVSGGNDGSGGDGGISLSRKVPTDRFLEFSLHVQQSEEFEREINFIRYFALDIFPHLCHADVCTAT